MEMSCSFIVICFLLFIFYSNSSTIQQTNKTELIEQSWGAEGKNFHPSGWQFTEEFSGL